MENTYFQPWQTVYSWTEKSEWLGAGCQLLHDQPDTRDYSRRKRKDKGASDAHEIWRTLPNHQRKFTYWKVPWVLALHPTLQGLCLSNFKTKERTQNQWQRHQWLNTRESVCVWSKVLKQHPTMCVAEWVEHDGSLCSQVEGESTSFREINIRWAYLLPGRPVEGYIPHCPFDKNLH